MFTLIKRAISAIPTPSAGKVTVFVDSASGQPYMKDEAGTSTTLVGTAGAAGAAGAAGPTGPDGTDSGIFWMGGSQGPQGDRGSAGATGATGAAGAGSDETLLWMESKQQAPVTAAGALIGLTVYNPGTLSDVSSASTSLADVDATNLTVTFVPPASGRVVVTLSARQAMGGSTNPVNWGLRVGSSDVAGSTVQGSSGGNAYRVTADIVVSGLTPGVAITYKWAHSVTTSGTAHTYAGGTSGQAVMKVIAA